MSIHLPKPAVWQLRSRKITFGKLPLLMGILNVTPDSFSDGGQHYTTSLAVDWARKLEDDGADLLDIGGESTRPYSAPIDEEEELRRVVPVLEAIQGKIAIPISIDTMKSKVAEAAISLGAEIINDVSGLTADESMCDTALKTQAGICAMHMQGKPSNMQDHPSYRNVVEEVLQYLEDRCSSLQAMGIAKERICLDPGIGFGKTHEHNMQLFQQVEQFHRTERPILIGHSRKGLIAKILGNKSLDRTFGTIGISLAMAQKGIQILRVHDIAANRQALQLYAACLDGET